MWQGSDCGSLMSHSELMKYVVDMLGALDVIEGAGTTTV